MVLFYDCVPSYLLMLNASLTTFPEVSKLIYSRQKATQMLLVPTFMRLRVWPLVFVV